MSASLEMVCSDGDSCYCSAACRAAAGQRHKSEANASLRNQHATKDIWMPSGTEAYNSRFLHCRIATLDGNCFPACSCALSRDHVLSDVPGQAHIAAQADCASHPGCANCSLPQQTAFYIVVLEGLFLDP